MAVISHSALLTVKAEQTRETVAKSEHLNSALEQHQARAKQ